MTCAAGSRQLILCLVRPMSTRLAVVVLTVYAGLAFAAPAADEEAFLRVSGASPLTGDDRSFSTAQLPIALRAAVESHDWGTEDGSLPSELSGFTDDLNRDGRQEYFIYNGVYSGSGGSFYLVFAEVNGTWRDIVAFQGSLHLFPTRRGWPRLVSISRGGGGIWSKTHHEFRRGKYEATRIERYERGVITNHRLPRK